MTIQDLLSTAEEARKTAYAPYSRYQVGAALMTTGGRLFTGVNIENASYGLTICAERVAVFSAVAAGERRFEALAITSSGRHEVTPCGACLQVLAEFAPDIKVITSDGSGRFNEYVLKDLLPRAFSWSAERIRD